MSVIVLAGADLVLPDRVQPEGSLLIDDGVIVAVEPRTVDTPAGAVRLDGRGLLVAPGFIDVHVHGVQGVDVLDGSESVEQVAARLPRYGVTAFCPTAVACAPAALTLLLQAVAQARLRPAAGSARVLPAHLESNFINPAYRGAQPLDCLRRAPPPDSREVPTGAGFTGADILAAIDERRDAVAIVTLAPEIEGGFRLIRRLTEAGHRVSIGHSGATFEEARAAIEAGVCHATHLFNRMSPLRHRAPGVAGAVLQSDAVAAEIICDGYHVHPSMVALALRAKRPERILAITDGTAGSGLPVGSRARLGGRTIVVTEHSAALEDGTLAGSTLTMDGAFRMLVQTVGLPLVEASRACSTTPANELRMSHLGRIAPGATADLVVLDPGLHVRATFVGGLRVFGEPDFAAARL